MLFKRWSLSLVAALAFVAGTVAILVMRLHPTNLCEFNLINCRPWTFTEKVREVTNSNTQGLVIVFLVAFGLAFVGAHFWARRHVGE